MVSGWCSNPICAFVTSIWGDILWQYTCEHQHISTLQTLFWILFKMPVWSEYPMAYRLDWNFTNYALIADCISGSEATWTLNKPPTEIGSLFWEVLVLSSHSAIKHSLQILQVSYAIGVAQPLSVFVDTYGTGKISDKEILAKVLEKFDFRPGKKTQSYLLPFILSFPNLDHTCKFLCPAAVRCKTFGNVAPFCVWKNSSSVPSRELIIIIKLWRVIYLCDFVQARLARLVSSSFWGC